MDKRELEKRTMQFALKIIAFVATLPKNKVGDVITYQLVKAGTSVGANYPRQIAPNRETTSFIRSGSLRKKLLKVSTGCSYAKKESSEMRRSVYCCSRKPANS